MTRMTQPLRNKPPKNQGPGGYNPSSLPTGVPSGVAPNRGNMNSNFGAGNSRGPGAGQGGPGSGIQSSYEGHSSNPWVPGMYGIQGDGVTPGAGVPQPPSAPPGSPRPPGGGGGGRGGGAPRIAPAGIDQATYDRWLAAQGDGPQQVTYTDLDLPDYVMPEYTSPEFYEWDGAQYGAARNAISDGISGARRAAGGALDRSAAAYAGAGNPFSGRDFARTQNIDPRLQASMDAYGGQSGANEAMQESLMNDAAMGSMYDLLGRSTDQFNTNMVNSVSGDRAQMQERMGMAQTMLNHQVNMAEAQAKSMYEKEKWQFGVEEARRRYEARVAEARTNYEAQVAEATANNRGRNEASQANTLMQNQYEQDQLQTALELWMAGINGAGNQTLDLSGEF